MSPTHGPPDQPRNSRAPEGMLGESRAKDQRQSRPIQSPLPNNSTEVAAQAAKEKEPREETHGCPEKTPLQEK
eukprot:CAMPEP_0181304802 /NCGR_PEP_ID=MMETSP1101-20121128/9361_1 /TAXON_ID=46948 /ORGANISM="Rhodomonas abbreviata, Strain Caron Lab Isolate" /LENGTH=72 /DNA_ID=CAMNT_0023410617 /DNA_START=199 /DNA_END=414 /DNA_ORIENTATION=+